ncbi:hypothetical protein [Azospirillum sp. sgz301742]
MVMFPLLDAPRPALLDDLVPEHPAFVRYRRLVDHLDRMEARGRISGERRRELLKRAAALLGITGNGRLEPRRLPKRARR